MTIAFTPGTKKQREHRESFFESTVFSLLIVLNLIPVLLFRVFPTLDGAAHLYNANLIVQLIKGNAFISDYFVFNPEPVPNWTGHGLLIFFNSFLPGYLAEKVLMITLLISLPLAFRSLIKVIAPQNPYFSYLIFPFTYSFIFFLGFYNFYIAVVIMFFILSFYIKQSAEGLNFRKYVVLFVLLTALYFSHIFIYGISGFILGLHLMFQVFRRELDSHRMLRWARMLVLAAFPTLMLGTYYFVSRPSPEEVVYLPSRELFQWLTFVRPAVIFNFEEEGKFAGKLIWLIITLCIIALTMLFKGKKQMSYWIISNFLWNTWLWVFVLITFLYFTFPDSMKWTSFISVRLGLLLFLFLIAWMATWKYPRWTGYLILAGVIIISVGLYSSQMKTGSQLAKMAADCVSASELIEENKVVFPLNYSDWMADHFANYLGADKALVVLENYEARLDYFPLKWNMESVPHTLIGNTNIYQIPCAFWVTDTLHSARIIDFIFILGDQAASTDSCHQQLRRTIFEGYEPIYKSEYCELFRLRN